MNRFGISGSPAAATSSWYDALGRPIAAPDTIRVRQVNTLSGIKRAVWQDANGNAVNDPALPAPTLNMVGMTARLVGEAWIYGGQTADGSRPRGL